VIVLIEVSRREVLARHNQCDIATFRALWSDYPDLACFLCDAPTGPDPFTIVLPNKPRNSPDKVLAAPLCPSCTALPQMKRFHRCLRLLRAMWSKQGGRQIHFR
jgi:hypothetical protein